MTDTTTSSNAPQITLQTKDKQEFKMPSDIAFQSKLVKDMVEPDDFEEGDNVIPLPNVDGPTFAKIQEYMNHHHNNPGKEIEKPLKSEFNDMISDWDKKFLEMDDVTLVNVINASNYLDIKPLLELCCAKVASTLKGKSVSEIRRMFIPEDEESDEESDGEEED